MSKTRCRMLQREKARAMANPYGGSGFAHTDASMVMECAEGGADSTRNISKLLFFYDCETTGFNIYREHITEIAAKVVGLSTQMKVSQQSFHRLVYTRRYISDDVQEATGITEGLLRDKRPFLDVFLEFMEWISNTTEELSCASTTSYTPVLVAHNGYRFDFPILLAEIERCNGLRRDVLVKQKIHFADTLPPLRKKKKDGHSELKLNLKDLHSQFSERTYSAHRALSDVEAMEDIFTTPFFYGILSTLPTISAEEQLRRWDTQKKIYHESKSLHRDLNTLGPNSITSEQVKQLHYLSLDRPALQTIRNKTSTDDEFMKELKKIGKMSKPLQEKLAALFIRQ